MLKKRILQTGLAAALLAAVLALTPTRALAGYFEISFGGSFSESQYSDSSFNWTRRYGATFGYHFTDNSEIEIAFQDVFDRTVVDALSDTSLHDQIYSVNWVQMLLPKTFPVQPYVKVGVGQIARDLSGSYNGITLTNANGDTVIKNDSLTGILGGGLRIYFTQRIALRCEATTYLTGGSIATWKQNIATQIGLSFYF